MDSDHFLVIGKSTGEVVFLKCCLMVAFCRRGCLAQGGSVLFTELTNYDRSGVRMQMNGFPASPLQIVSAHMVREESNYMRDYILDEQGMIRELDFNSIGTDHSQVE